LHPELFGKDPTVQPLLDNKKFGLFSNTQKHRQSTVLIPKEHSENNWLNEMKS